MVCQTDRARLFHGGVAESRPRLILCEAKPCRMRAELTVYLQRRSERVQDGASPQRQRRLTVGEQALCGAKSLHDEACRMSVCLPADRRRSKYSVNERTISVTQAILADLGTEAIGATFIFPLPFPFSYPVFFPISLPSLPFHSFLIRYPSPTPVLHSGFKTRSSADADNGLDAFSGQSRSTNMVPFWVHCDFSLSM